MLLLASSCPVGKIYEASNVCLHLDYVWSHCPTSCQRYDNNGRYPLHVAALCGKIEILDWLITTFECDLNVQDEESSWTPLHRSIYYGRLACAVLLIEVKYSSF